MALTTSDWSQSFPLTERNQIVSLLEAAFIAEGDTPTTTLTADDVEAVLIKAAGLLVPKPTIPPSP